MDFGTAMNTKYSRDELIEQLETALDAFGANPARWPVDRRARLSAFVESDEDALRRFRDAKAFERLIGQAPQGASSTDLENRIVNAALVLPQQRGDERSKIVSFASAVRQDKPIVRGQSEGGRRPVWGAAMLAASLMIGVYIGVSGDVIPALQKVAFFTANGIDPGFDFPAPLFDPGGFQENDQI